MRISWAVSPLLVVVTPPSPPGPSCRLSCRSERPPCFPLPMESHFLPLRSKQRERLSSLPGCLAGAKLELSFYFQTFQTFYRALRPPWTQSLITKPMILYYLRPLAHLCPFRWTVPSAFCDFHVASVTLPTRLLGGP